MNLPTIIHKSELCAVLIEEKKKKIWNMQIIFCKLINSSPTS